MRRGVAMRAGIRAAAWALTVLATGMPAMAHAASVQRTSVERIYSFDGVGDGVLLVSGTVDPGKGRGLFASVAGNTARTGGALTQAFFPQILDLDSRHPHTYGAIGARDLCIDPHTVCDALPGGGLGFSSTFVVTGDGQHASHVRFAVVVRGAKITFKEKMIGWQGSDLHAVHQITDDQAQGAGAAAFDAAAGVTLAATAPAGARGSVAIAAPPCDVIGAGIALLSGPAGTTPGICPTNAFAAVTSRGGTWALTGPAAGISGRSTRLLVLDL